MIIQRPLIAIEQLRIEDALRGAGYRHIAGIDEVGRGCWAGPVFAGVVILEPDCYHDRSLLAEVTDSKLLTAGKRARLADEIVRHAAAVAVGWASAVVVDRLNVVGATRVAMTAALRALDGAAEEAGPGVGARRLSSRPLAPDFVLLDAIRLDYAAVPQQSVVKGDRSCLAVAAASIVAKVMRDAEMCRLAPCYPAYDFARNKGYGTRRHFGALRANGVTPLHRRTFAPVKYLIGLRDHVAGSLPWPAHAPA